MSVSKEVGNFRFPSLLWAKMVYNVIEITEYSGVVRQRLPRDGSSRTVQVAKGRVVRFHGLYTTTSPPSPPLTSWAVDLARFAKMIFATSWLAATYLLTIIKSNLLQLCAELISDPRQT